MTRARDSQKSKLYKAEGVLDPISRRLETIPEIQAFLTRVLTKATVQRRYGEYLQGEIKVRDGRGASIARGGAHYIKMPKWSRCEHIVLHEIAHTICTRRHGSDVAAHGREYAAIYLDMIRFGMSADAAEKLKESFKENRVRFRPKKGSAPAVLMRPIRRGPLVVRPAIPIAAKSRKVVDPSYKAFRQLASKHGFTYEIEREHGTSLAWITITPFAPFEKDWTTLHYDWSTTIDRLERCIADPSLVDEGGGFSE